MGRLMKLREFERELGISPWTCYRWLKSGVVKGVRLPNGQLRVSEEELQRVKAERLPKGV